LLIRARPPEKRIGQLKEAKKKNKIGNQIFSVLRLLRDGGNDIFVIAIFVIAILFSTEL
jgi:hypothetical protein